jgi:xanthine dehydrogenase iron-sulfur cluster and FAD-binding subunit A
VTAARQIGALQIQTRGTVGGNIATSSPVGDTLP